MLASETMQAASILPSKMDVSWKMDVLKKRNKPAGPDGSSLPFFKDRNEGLISKLKKTPGINLDDGKHS